MTEPDELLSWDRSCYTPPDRCAVHVHGWLEYEPTSELVTCVPLIDTETNLFARPSYAGLLQVAERLGAELLTTTHVDSIHRLGTKLTPPLQPDQDLRNEAASSKALGLQRRQGEPSDAWLQRLRDRGMGSARWALQLDRAIWTQLGDQGWQGGSLVSNGWKDWVQVPGLSASKSANYGLFDPRAPYRHPTMGNMWQTLGMRHNRNHWDYSQLGRLRKRKAQPMPLGSTGALSVVAFVKAQQVAGVREKPGPEHSKEILAYLKRCRRGGSPLAGMPGAAELSGGPLGLSTDETEWCAAGRSAGVYSAVQLVPGFIPPHGYRCACWELLADARALGTYRDARSDYRPKPGDAAVYKRNGQDPRTPGMQGHVRTVTWVGGVTYEAFGGNEANTWGRGIYRTDDEDLVAWIET